MVANKNQDQKFVVSSSDILSLFLQSKKKIFICALVCSIVGFFLALTKPIRYQAEGTFREKGTSTPSVTSSLSQIFGGSIIGGESEAASLMTSRRILKDVIEKLHLQATLEAVSDVETKSKLMRHNLQLAWADLFSNSFRPVLKDLLCPLKIQSMQYTGEHLQIYLIEMKDGEQYEVRDLLNSKQIGSGKLDSPFVFEELTLTLASQGSEPEVKTQSYILTLNSLPNTVKNLSNLLKVETGKLDKSLLILKCEHRDRFLASAIINGAMSSYQSYLKNYHSDMSLNQLDYLSLRRDQLTQNLINSMHKHADFLANDLYNAGFIESNKEMDFLAKNQHEYKKKLLENEVKIKRLSTITPSNLAYYDHYSNDEGDPSIINSVLSEMRSLKQQRDSLEIEIQKKTVDRGINLQQSFEKQINELTEIQNYLNELQEIVLQYQKGNLPDSNSRLLNDSRFLLKGWFDRVREAQNDSSKHWKETKENFQFYLNNLERLFRVHERILQERLTHQQNPSGEYQGISLELATNLYLEYSKQLIQIEGTIRQNLFFIHQIEDPNFEITSLSSGLTDPVSSEMIQKASDLILHLRDQNNQSVREQERIKEEHNLKRLFLTIHLKQMVQLMELNKELIDEKVFALQNVSLELIHQRISLLEKNLQDYLKSRLENLEHDRHLIKKQLESVHSEMALLPQKWVSEQILTQEMEINHRIVEEIAKLVESRNIAHNLEVIQSAPVDQALPPVHPIMPKVIFSSILGFLLGGFLAACFVVGKAMVQGLNVSHENLELRGFSVSGTLTSPILSSDQQLQQRNVDTLRRLHAYFDNFAWIEAHPSAIPEAKLLLLVEGKGPHYAPELADLFLKKGCRVLTIDLDFTVAKENLDAGLLQYFQGKIASPPIQKGVNGDLISSGGICPFAIEMLGSEAFKKLIEQLKPHYDWILAVSKALPLSVEAESLAPLFQYMAVTLQQEKIEALSFYTHFLEQNPEHKLTFVLDCS
jgi:uncharacterized protein involved in exopolysaccharide biosynthesis